MTESSILLDVGGVLLVPRADVVGPALGTSVSPEAAERAHYEGAAALDAEDSGQPTERNAYWEAYTRSLGLDPAEAVPKLDAVFTLGLLEVWGQIVSGSVDGLRQLSAAGHRLGIISNSDGTVEEQLKRHQICQIGEGLGVPVLAIIDSHVVGISKPEAEIFRHAVEKLGVGPEECVYVGDTVRYDVTGARAAGIKPVHFDPYELCPARHDHAHVRRLGELLGEASQ